MSTTTINEEIQAMYMGLLDRPADAAGETYWQGQLGTSTTLNAAIENGFSNAGETLYYSDDKGGSGVAGVAITSANIANEIGNIYENLLGYTSSQVAAQIASSGSGINYWAGEYNAGMNIGTIAGTIINTVMGYSSGSAYIGQKTFLTTVADNAQTYTTANANTPYSNSTSGGYFTDGQSVISIATAAAVPTGTTYTLPATPGYTISNPTTNNNTIYSYNPSSTSGMTAQPFDTINMGNTTGNVMDVYDTNSGEAIVNLNNFSSVSGVQTLNYYSSTDLQQNSSSANSANISSWTGLATANFHLSAVDESLYITAGSTTAVNLTDTISTASDSTITGGSTVTINENNVANNSSSSITVNGVSGTASVSVTQTGVTNDAKVTIIDVNHSSASIAGTITSVTLDGLNGTTTSAAIKDNALGSLTVNNVSHASTVTITSDLTTQTVTTLNLSLNNDTAAVTVDDANSKYTALDITTGAKASSATLEMAGVTKETVTGSSVLTQVDTTMTDLASIIIEGNAGFTSTDLGTLTNLTTVTANTTGITDVALTSSGATTQYATFTGLGSGQDIVSIYSDATKAITGGTAANNEIVLTNVSASTYTHTHTFANVSGFSIAGIDALLTANATYDVSGGSSSILSGINTVDVMTDVAHGYTATFEVATGTALQIDASNNTASDSLVYQAMNTNGATDTASLTLGTASSSGITVLALTMEDNSATPVGIGTLNVNSIGSSAATITTLTDTALSHLNLSGASGLTIATLSSDVSASLALTNSSSGTLTIGSTAFADNSLTSVTLAGTGAISLAITGDTVGKAITINGASDNAASNTVDVHAINAATENVAVSLGTGLGNDVIVANSGVDTTYTNIDTVTFGAHTSTATLYDTVNLSNIASGEASFSTPTTTSQTSVLTGGLDIITGLTAGDKIVLDAAGGCVVSTASNLAGIVKDALFAEGTYSATAGTFTYNASGHDTLMTYDSTGTTGTGDYVSVVLVGTTVTSAIDHVATATITLA